MPKVPVSLVTLGDEPIEVRFSFRALMAAEKAYGKNIIREFMFGEGLGLRATACMVWAAVNLQHPAKNLKLEQVADLLEESPDGILGIVNEIGKVLLPLITGSRPPEEVKQSEGDAEESPSPKN